ncbi:protein kinase domain-containing protein [Schumannella luteola]
MTAGAASVNPWIAVLTSQSVGSYRLQKLIGEGQFGLVFEAIHEATGGRFAVKVLPPTSDTGAVLDFENEGILLRKLNPCGGVINFVDGGMQTVEVTGPGGVLLPLELRYHVMSQASGSLDELVLDAAIRSSLGWVERLRLWRSMTKSIMQMHQYGVAHRDLKCSNSLLHVTKGQTRVRFGDLGRARDLTIAGRLAPEHYLTGRGDWRFAPPEALFWQGGATRDDFLAADYYGLGSLLVELITGQSMTGLAIGDFKSALKLGQEDYFLGRQRDLSSLALRYRSVISEVAAQLPLSVQADARVMLASLCSPDPTARMVASPYSRDRESREKLAWILRRTDIMIRRLEIELRDDRRREKVSA